MYNNNDRPVSLTSRKESCCTCWCRYGNLRIRIRCRAWRIRLDARGFPFLASFRLKNRQFCFSSSWGFQHKVVLFLSTDKLERCLKKKKYLELLRETPLSNLAVPCYTSFHPLTRTFSRALIMSSTGWNREECSVRINGSL